MKKYKVSTAIILDTRRAKKTAIIPGTRQTEKMNVYPVKIRLTYKGDRQYYNIGYDMTEEEFALVEEGKGKYHEKKIKFGDIESEAKAVIDSIADFSFDEFKKKFFDDTNTADIFSMFRKRIKDMEDAGRPSTAASLQSTLGSLEMFHKHPTLLFDRITPKKLEDYEQYLRDQDKKDGTIALYQNNIKRVFNYAIDKGIVKKEKYPFGRNLYEVPQGDTFKRALIKADVLKIRHYNALPGSPEEYYRDLWMFSYLCNGMNLADIARLKYKNIIDGTIVFYRKKTERKVKKSKKMPIIIEISDEIQEIMDRWGSLPVQPETYIFNILRKGLTPAEEWRILLTVTAGLNRNIKRIAKNVGIKVEVTMYSARHSFASVLKLSGESTSYISEALGHQDLAQTEVYLSSFDRKQRRRAQKKLL